MCKKHGNYDFLCIPQFFSIYGLRVNQILGSMIIAAGGKGDGGDFFQTEEILTGSLLPSLPKPVNNIALLVGTDADGKNKVCSVSSLFV